MAGWCLAVGSSQARAPHGDQKSCVRIPSSWTSAAEGRAGGGERRGLGQEHTAALRVGHREAQARGQVGCGEGANQAPDPLTHLPPGPLSRSGGSGGREGERGKGQSLEANGLAGKGGGTDGGSETWPVCLCRATSSGLWGTPSPLPSQGLPPTPALRRLRTEGLAKSCSAGPRGEDRGRDPPRGTRERRPSRTRHGGRPLGVPEGDPLRIGSPGRKSPLSAERERFPSRC